MTTALQDQEILLVRKSYDVFKDCFALGAQLPKQVRYSLGVKLEANILDSIYLLNLASRSPKHAKEPLLLRIAAANDTVILLIRLLHDLECIELKKYLKLAERCDEIGRMIGGWIKYVRNNA